MCGNQAPKSEIHTSASGGQNGVWQVVGSWEANEQGRLARWRVGLTKELDLVLENWI